MLGQHSPILTWILSILPAHRIAPPTLRNPPTSVNPLWNPQTDAHLGVCLTSLICDSKSGQPDKEDGLPPTPRVLPSVSQLSVPTSQRTKAHERWGSISTQKQNRNCTELSSPYLHLMKVSQTAGKQVLEKSLLCGKMSAEEIQTKSTNPVCMGPGQSSKQSGMQIPIVVKT